MWGIGLVIGGLVGLALAVDHNTWLAGLLAGTVVGALSGWALGLQRRVAELERRLRRPPKADGQSRPAPAEPATPSPGPATPPAATAPQRAAGEIASRPAPTDPVPSAPRPPGPAAGPSVLARGLRFLRYWFTTGNIAAKVGVIISFFGVAFLLKYAADKHYLSLSIQARLSAVALAGIAGMVTGWRLRARNPVFALTLQGGAAGVLYLTVFAALRLYSLLPGMAAFTLLVGLTAGIGVLAVRQNARSLAILAVVGGFLAPLLASTGHGSHVALFGYYAILDLAVFGIAWWRAWRLLNLLGFAFTFVIGSLWGWRLYRPEHFASTEPFLILFFAIYLAVGVLYAWRRRVNLRAYLDATLIFGTPILAFPLQAALLKHDHYALAASAATLAALYAGLAITVQRSRQLTGLGMLRDAFAALAIVFLTIALPLALSAHWTSVSWALEGAALLWAGQRQRRLLASGAGLALQVLAGIAFTLRGGYPQAALPLLNGFYLGGTLLAITGMFSARELNRHREHFPRLNPPASWIALAWGLLWWLGINLTENHRQLALALQPAGAIGLFALTGGLLSLATRRLAWDQAGYPVLGLLPLLLMLALAVWAGGAAPLGHLGWLAWAAALASLLYFARLRPAALHRAIEPWWHAGGVWLLALLLGAETDWWLHSAATAWRAAALAVVPGALLLALHGLERRLEWPLRRQRFGYRVPGYAGLLLLTAGFDLGLLSRAGDIAPLPYLPLLNPLDLAAAFGLTLMLYWLRLVRQETAIASGLRRGLQIAVAGLAFLNLTAGVLRAVHQLADIGWRWHTLYHAVIAQAALSITWSVAALLIMLVGTRRASRGIYFVGAGLMAVVVAKLFLVDLGNTGALARVVTFIGVGLLLLIVGYFAPVPPKRPAATE